MSMHGTFVQPRSRAILSRLLLCILNNQGLRAQRTQRYGTEEHICGSEGPCLMEFAHCINLRQPVMHMLRNMKKTPYAIRAGHVQNYTLISQLC